MILKQYYLGCLAHASYMIVSERAKEVIVVDPQRDTNQYVADAKKMGVKIAHVFLTHFHADFLAGHLELRDSQCAMIYLGSKANAEYEFISMRDESELEIGEVRLLILETPGHSPESISIVVYDLDKDDEYPYAVLTGDTLFIGDVGRPDLRASLGWSAEELGGMLYDSVHNKLLKLPDSTLIYPAHGAGSLCGKKMSDETVSTIGEQKKYNYALRNMSKQNFINIVTENQPEAPSYFTYDAILNTKERQTLDDSIKRTLKPLGLDTVLKLKSKGVQILDVREPEEYAAAHMNGSINIGLGGKFATWAGTLLDNERHIVIIASPGREQEAAIRLGRIGYDNISGYLDGGMSALKDKNDLIRETQKLAVQEVYEDVNSESDLCILDVRSKSEWESAHIKESINIPLNQLLKKIDELPKNKFIVVHCQGGYRSSIACSILGNSGIEDFADMIGGISAWDSAHLPVN
jgi:hydroxyacylglutathione hydrolase